MENMLIHTKQNVGITGIAWAILFEDTSNNNLFQ